MSRLLLRIAVVYALAGIALGIYMSVTGNYALKTTHAHINLVGWVSLAIMGLAYASFPALERSLLAKIHVWTHNLGLPPMSVGVAMIYTGHAEAGEPAAKLGSVLVAVGFICFALNVWRNINR